MEILTEGKKTNAEMAKWFGIAASSYSCQKAKKLEELKNFAEFKIEKGKVVITKVLNPIYTKQSSKAYQLIRSKIDECWNEDGLDSCKRVGKQIQKELKNELSVVESTVYTYTRRGRNELYGVPFQNNGTIGSCTYLWCKKEGDGIDTKYSKFTKEEEEIKDNLLKKYFGNTTEKQIIVQEMIDANEIKEEDAWSVLKELTNLTKANFKEFLDELQEKLQCQVVRGTLVVRDRDLIDKRPPSAF